MAVITITEILGGDNIAGSRVTINDNFKRLANSVNTIETRLDTSFNPGGSLNVGNALIRRYTNPTSSQIFTCEASGLFQGNLNVSLDLGVTRSISAGLDLNASRNIVFDGAATGGGSFTSQVRSSFSNEIVNVQLDNSTALAPSINPQTLLPASSASRNITTVKGYSVLRFDLSSYNPSVTPANNCTTVILPAVTNTSAVTAGQVLTVIIDVPATDSMVGGFKIAGSSLATGNDLAIGVITDPNTADILKLAVTLFADHNGWRVLSTAQVSAGDITY